MKIWITDLILSIKKILGGCGECGNVWFSKQDLWERNFKTKESMKYLLLLFSFLLVIQCTVQTKNNQNIEQNFKIDTLMYFDQSRDRKIPVAIYQPQNKNKLNKIPIIFSHGWGENQGGAYFDYSYLTEFLASKGYFVVSIQHELSTDEMLAMEGDLKITRKQNWERGAQNIHYVLSKIKTEFPDLDYKKLALIGHSNGGDMTVLYAHQHPDLVHKIISMDNRRMNLPRTSNPKIYTLRSKDYPADEGVLPTNEEQKRYEMTVDFTNINHSDMDKDANAEERNYMTEKILSYLKE